MTARQLAFVPAAAARHWRSLALAALVLLLAATAIKTTAKALKPGRTGELSRTAFLRWRPQIHALGQGTDVYRAFNYPNPPVMALILMPLAHLPPLAGLLAWFALKALMAAAMVVWAFRLIERGGMPMPDWSKWLALGLALHPLLGDLSHGNVNIFIAFLVAAGLELYRRGHDGCSGVVFALAIACKITPALFVPYFLWKRSWRWLAGAALGSVLWWGAAPSLAFGLERTATLTTGWFDVMVRPFMLEGRITSEHANQSLPGLLTRLLADTASFVDYDEETGRPFAAERHTLVNLGPGGVDAIVKCCLAAFAAAVLWLGRSRHRSGLAFAAECAVIVLGMLLFSERTWKHHACMLILPAAVLAAAYAAGQRRLIWIIAAVPVLALVPSAAGDRAQDLFLVYGAYTAMYVLMLIGCFAVCWSESRRQMVVGNMGF